MDEHDKLIINGVVYVPEAKIRMIHLSLPVIGTYLIDGKSYKLVLEDYYNEMLLENKTKCNAKCDYDKGYTAGFEDAKKVFY
jgi:NADPH-dependent 7-cyano-7-deazaguanine reductase QueF-like protein